MAFKNAIESCSVDLWVLTKRTEMNTISRPARLVESIPVISGPLVLRFEAAKLPPSPWPRGWGCGAAYRRGSKLATMWFRSQKFSVCRPAGLQTLHYAGELKWRVVLWHRGSHLENSRESRKDTYGCSDPSSRRGTDPRLKIIISPEGNERTRKRFVVVLRFPVNSTCAWHFIYWHHSYSTFLVIIFFKSGCFLIQTSISDWVSTGW